jgi:hypothetical protein
MVIAFIIILVHFVADFLLQTEEMAVNKSKDNYALFSHVLTYSTVWLFASCLILGITRPHETTSWYVENSILFFGATFLLHYWTDYFTSRITSKKFANKEYYAKFPGFGAFAVIGFDQVLHYAQLFYTYNFIITNK